MVDWVEPEADLTELLLDRQIFDAGGRPVGKVDDVEFTEAADGGAPVLSAILCGPAALGPRIGGALGVWWYAIARRLRPDDDPYPVRIPFEEVKKVDRVEIVLHAEGESLGPDRLRDWTRDKIVSRIPGGST